MTNLSVDQQSAIKKLEELKVGALFMEPGTGKTRTAVELINSSAAEQVLFIVPFQTKRNLEDELRKWGLNKLYRIEGVESLSNSDRLYLELINYVSSKTTFMVVDESLKIKNRLAKRTKRVLKLGELSEFRLVLNGTPLSKNILDLWTQMEFLSHKILNMGYNEFKNTFVDYVIFRDRGMKKEYIRGFENMDYLYSLIKPYVFDSKLNLGIQEQTVDVDYIINDTDKYYEVKQRMLQNIYMDSIVFLKFTQQMQQSYSLDSGKVKVVDKLVSDDTIIFCKYVKTKEFLKKRYPNCLVLTYGKGALGLNLQAYNKIIFWDKTWDYAQLEQAQRRIYRLGQKTDVTYYNLTGNVGLERMMNKSIHNKTTLLRMFKESAMKGEQEKLIKEEL